MSAIALLPAKLWVQDRVVGTSFRVKLWVSIQRLGAGFKSYLFFPQYALIPFDKHVSNGLKRLLFLLWFVECEDFVK